MAENLPKGVVAVFVGSDGHAVASCADFDQSGYGGYTMQEAQTHRIRETIARRVAEAFASTEFTKHLDTYKVRCVIDQMIARDGYFLHIIPVGYEAVE
jgi:hypothetical protein